ncbi:MAG: septal ring factor EnvC (AmiA/AmiB activator) [Planctomycetota bacterium]
MRPFSILPLLLFVLLGVNSAAIADEKEQKAAELKALQEKIEKLKQTIEVKEDSRSRYGSQLKSIESKISAVSNNVRLSNNAIDDKKSELSALGKQRRENQQQLSRESEGLAEQIYSAFTLGKQEKVKLLFSQQDAQVFQRNLVYYQYFSEARVDIIKGVQNNIDLIIESENKIARVKLELEADRQRLKSQQSELSKDRQKRKSIISLLDKQLKKQGGQLVQLKNEAGQLEKLINSIEDIFTDISEPELDRKPFAQLRGKLPWPVAGKVEKLFGRTKLVSDLRWQGIIITAPNGRYVKAVSHGRVAFADWLRGFGNLVIIDHGNSYLSLYGHNESIFKAAGEWVESGEIISSVGDSGGQAASGLYFEIRKKGKPQNPTRWCKTGNQFTS